LHRSGLIADVLTSRGDDVVWWTSRFRHSDKVFRDDQGTSVCAGDRLKIHYLLSRPYRKNVSLARILANRDVAKEFRTRAAPEKPPDVILASYPIPELAQAGAQYARSRGIPSVVDIRDLWPDMWTSALPGLLRPAGSVAALPFYWHSRRTLGAFDGICGITDAFVEWGLTRASRTRRTWDRAFPLAYADSIYTADERTAAQLFWAEKLGGLPPAHLRLCFFGNIADRARLDVAIDAIRLLPQEIRNQTRLVMCGAGENFESLRRSAAGIVQIVMPGWVTGPQIEVLASQSHAGILPYPSDADFRRSIPNKVIEYLAHGLPVLASLQGPVSQLVDREKCGLIYRETDPADLARKICELFQSPERLTQMSANSSRVFRDRYHAPRVYGEMADMLAELAKRKAPGEH
jgi:glycosyltransferase involved in cell wall biosynthesis